MGILLKRAEKCFEFSELPMLRSTCVSLKPPLQLWDLSPSEVLQSHRYLFPRATLPCMGLVSLRRVLGGGKMVGVGNWVLGKEKLYLPQ